MSPSSINLTKNALVRIESVLGNSNSSKFRVYVTGGGCSGFQYGFKFDDEEAFDDDVIDFGNFKVLIDSMSYPYFNQSFSLFTPCISLLNAFSKSI